jgi:hypothetical protein
VKQFGISLIAFTLALAALALPANAAQQVIVNSQDWKDVYAAVLYASLKGMLPANGAPFLSSQESALEAWKYWNKNDSILLFESSQQPFYPNYESFLKSQGFTVTTQLSTGGDFLVMDLARQSGVKNFIVTEGNTGYNAVSLLPYAVQTKSFVLFAGKENAQQVKEFLKAAQPAKVIEYGPLPKQVTDALAEFNPEAINKGDKFSNNIEIVKRFIAENNAKQLILTSGEFIEPSIAEGKLPVLLLGVSNPTQAQIDFIKNSGITLATLIGNELIGSAKLLKDSTGTLSVFVKYGKGIPGKPGVQPLDRFFLPRYNLAIKIKSVQYNLATKQLEVAYENTGGVTTFAQAHMAFGANGQRIATAKENPDEPFFTLEPDETRTRTYDVDLVNTFKNGQQIDLNETVLYGEDVGAMDHVLFQQFNAIKTVEFTDNSNVNIGRLAYDLSKHAFLLTLENTATEPAYAKTKITYSLNNEKITLTANATQVTSTTTVEFPQALTRDAAEAAASQPATITIDYGKRSDVLIKTKTEQRRIEVIGSEGFTIWLTGFWLTGFGYLQYSNWIWLLAVLALIVAALAYWKRRSKRGEHHLRH